jgi:Gas vesicle synthesis protein GvpL/GvpF
MKLYVYCLAEDIEAPNESIRGISGAGVRLVRIENLAVLVSDFEGDAIPVTRENALDHAAVVRSVLNRTTPLPFRFGTVVTEEQLRNYISARKPALESKLALVRGCVEMSVKIIWAPANYEKPESQNDQLPNQGCGAKFLAEKRREILGDEQRASEAQELSGWLRRIISGLARDEQVTVRPGEKLVLAAAHLIERAGIPSYREKLVAARQERPDLHFLVSGPWAPYSFANIELEFNSGFGVS